MSEGEPLGTVLEALRGAGEETRLRILHALSGGELAVSELTQVLGQSQPRVSRHLKLMADAGLIERRREGAWAFFRLAREGFGARLARFALDGLEAREPDLEGDRRRLAEARARRAEAAEAYFRENAADWDAIRSLHAPEAEVEAAARALLDGRFARLLDLGTGTGRMLALFADRYDEGTGYDVSQPMLGLARTRLDAAGIRHAEVRQGSILALPEPEGAASAAVIHQVLHFLAEPAIALAEAGRVLAPGGRLLIVDFAPHGEEALRERHAHRRLGFAREEVEEMARGLAPLAYERVAGTGTALTVSLWLLGRPA